MTRIHDSFVHHDHARSSLADGVGITLIKMIVVVVQKRIDDNAV